MDGATVETERWCHLLRWGKPSLSQRLKVTGAYPPAVFGESPAAAAVACHSQINTPDRTSLMKVCVFLLCSRNNNRPHDVHIPVWANTSSPTPLTGLHLRHKGFLFSLVSIIVPSVIMAVHKTTYVTYCNINALTLQTPVTSTARRISEFWWISSHFLRPDNNKYSIHIINNVIKMLE